jgi:hypothetical protein
MKIIQALKIVFRKDRGVNLIYISLFLFFVIAFILFFIELQVLLTPEPDDLFLYLKIWQIKDWLIVGLLSILVSLNFVFFVYLITHTNSTRIKNESDMNNKTRTNYELTNTSESRIERINHKLNNKEFETNSLPFVKNSYINKFVKHSWKFEINSYNKIRDKFDTIRDKFVYSSTGILGTLSGIFSAILATAFCSSCLAVLFSLLGISFSTGIFFLRYKFLIFLLSTILLLLSLHFQSKRIIEKCKC